MEHSYIAWVKQRVSKLPQVAVGIGDDAAILDRTDRRMVVTTDSLCEGTHFRLEECGARKVGRKLAGVNLSDLAAMGADPVALFVSVCLPRGEATSIGAEIMEGILELAEPHAIPIAGGDTNVWDGPLVVHMTAIGSEPEGGSWLRSGARVGDAIVVSGTLGGSITAKQFEFEPRLKLARALRNKIAVHAAMDISDGLGIDLQSMCSQSKCGARLQMDAIPISPAAEEIATKTGRPPLDHAMADGEDFELLLAVPQSELSKLSEEIEGVKLTVIGEFISRTGLWTKQGAQWKQVPPKGYVHR